MQDDKMSIANDDNMILKTRWSQCQYYYDDDEDDDDFDDPTSFFSSGSSTGGGTDTVSKLTIS